MVPKQAVFFITKDGKAYQVKGAMKRLTEGAAFDNMKSWNDPKHPGHAVAVVEAEEVFSGAEKLI